MTAVAMLVDAGFDLDAAERIVNFHDGPPRTRARARTVITDVLHQRGGALAHAQLLTYLADLTGYTVDEVADELLDGITDGRYAVRASAGLVRLALAEASR